MSDYQLMPLQIRPGIYSEETQRGAENRWHDGNRVRWRNGIPETIGGWVPFSGIAEDFITDEVDDVYAYFTNDPLFVGGLFEDSKTSIRFNGVDQNVFVRSDAPFLDVGSGSFTFECWARFTALDSNHRVFSRIDPSTGAGYYLSYQAASDSFWFFVEDGGGNQAVAIAGFSGIDEPVHIACTRESGGDIKIYLNGVLESTTDASAVGSLNASEDLTIGSAASSGYMEGDIDEFRMWNDVRTETEINQRMNEEIATDASGLQLVFRMDRESKIKGVARNTHDWSSLDGNKWLAVGTSAKLYLWRDGTVSDITPLDINNPSGSLGTDPFSTTVDSRIVTVTSTAHGREGGDYVIFANATSVGGLDMNGEFIVTEAVDSNTFKVKSERWATATATGGGSSVTYEYLLETGSVVAQSQQGWGTGGWGLGGWGEPTAEEDVETAISEVRTWSLDNWGEDLIASPRGGPIFWWDRTNNESSRATEISEAPDTNERVLVSPEGRHLIALGAHDGTSSDPLFIRWCDSEDFTDWTPSSTNLAGDLRVDSGSRIITAIKSRGQTIVFTDTTAFSLQYLGDAVYVFGVKSLGGGVGIASPNAATEVNGRVYWMATEDFYIYDGTIRPLRCDIRNHVFEDFNALQQDKVIASPSRDFTEIWWFYPSSESEENDRYACYNYSEDIWYYGTMERTAFHDRSSLKQRPYGIDSHGVLYEHERGFNGDDNPLRNYLETYGVEIGQGDSFFHIRALVPDFMTLGGSVDVYLKAKRYPQADTTDMRGPYNVTRTTERVSTRQRGRQIAMRIESNELNDRWRMGEWRAFVRPHGRR